MTIFKTGMEGFYTINLKKPDGTEKNYFIKNKITSAGLQHFAKGGGNVIDRIFLFQKKSGYGLTFATSSLNAASNYRYAHTAFAGESTEVVNRTSTAPYYKWVTAVQFDPTIITQPVDHIAVVFGSDTMFSHTPIKDDAGLPTQLFIGPQDVVTVSYELRLWLSTAPTSVTNVDLGQFGTSNVTIRPCGMTPSSAVYQLMKMGFKFRPSIWSSNNVYENNGTTRFTFYNGPITNIAPNHYSVVPTSNVVATTEEPYDFSTRNVNIVVQQDTGVSIGYLTTLSVVIPKDIVPVIERGYHGIKMETTIGDYYIDFGKLLERNQRIRYDLTLNVGFLIGAEK